MGNALQGRSPPTPRFLHASRQFSESELRDLRALFLSLAFQSRSDGEFISASVFQAYYGIHGSLGSRLFDLVSGSRKDGQLYYEDLVIVKATYEKGSPDEVENFMYQLVDLLGDGLVQRTEAESVVLSILQTVMGPKEAIPDASLPDSVIQGFVNSAPFSVKNDRDEECMSTPDFHTWCLVVPSIKKFLSSLMAQPSPEQNVLGRHVPKLSNVPENLKVVLRKEFAWHISGALQQQDTEQWILLYHSSLHGLSFNTFLTRLSSVGSSIVVIKDKDGCVFGGYASNLWDRHADFFGDLKSFLFGLQPLATIYRASGGNNNIQWCAVNYTSESIPNGIGFGGQKNHFGLFIPASFDKGYSYPSVTFNNPALAKKLEFSIDVLECWGIVSESNNGNLQKRSAQSGTVLQRFKEDRNMLNMVGIANASD